MHKRLEAMKLLAQLQAILRPLSRALHGVRVGPLARMLHARGCFA